MTKNKRLLFTVLSSTVLLSAAFLLNKLRGNNSPTAVKVDKTTDSAKDTVVETIPQSKISVTAFTTHAGNGASLMLDNDPKTFWHSEWSPMANPPHTLTFNLGGQYDNLYRLRYLPRQDGNTNGNITSYEIFVSNDGFNFIKVAEGNWFGDSTEKTASFTPVSASHVRLQILAGVGNFGSAAEINFETAANFKVDNSGLKKSIIEAKETLDKLMSDSQSNIDKLNNGLIKSIATAEKAIGSKYSTQEQYEYAKSTLEKTVQAFNELGKKTHFEPGEIWFDTAGVPIQAHAAGIIYDENYKKYFMYGEERTLGYANYTGVSVYSSTDLYNWTNEGVALKAADVPSQFQGKNNGINERPKVIYNKSTKKYVMWVHADDGAYKISQAGVATSDSPTGPFTWVKSFRPITETSYFEAGDYANQDTLGGTYRDMNLFVDDDGTGYAIYSSEQNYTMYIIKLTPDYTDIEVDPVEGKPVLGKNWARVFVRGHREAPAPFKYNGKYYMITSGCTGWTPNQANYAVADSMFGPWTVAGDPVVGDPNNNTFASQSTFVLPIHEKPGTFIFIGDRWNPQNLSDSRYIWLPLTINNGKVSIEWMDKWNLDDLQPSS